MQTSIPASARVLLAGAVDYAGLFPPAALGMPEAVAEYLRGRASEGRWALGRFVAPASRLEEFGSAARAAGVLSSDDPIALSALIGADAAADHLAIEQFNRTHHPLGAVVDAVEGRAATAPAATELATRFAGPFACWVEVPLDGALPAVLDALVGTGAGPKIRMGGVVASGFPSADQVVQFLVEVLRRGLPYKATAGLHHPVRGDYRLTYASDSASGTMHGYLNLLLATALLQSGGTAEQARALLLLTPDAATPRLDEDGATWGAHHFSLEALQQARQAGMQAFGSCSFREPLSDLEQVMAA